MDGGIRRVPMDRDLQPVRLNARPVMAEHLEAACDAVGQDALIGARPPLPEVVTTRTKRCEQGDEKQVAEHVFNCSAAEGQGGSRWHKRACAGKQERHLMAIWKRRWHEHIAGTGRML